MEFKFIKQSPCCGSELNIIFDSEAESIYLECLKKSKSAKVAEKAAEISAPVKKCDFCFKAAIRGGHLCKDHSFCGQCNEDIVDGIDRAVRWVKLPRCSQCAQLK